MDIDAGILGSGEGGGAKCCAVNIYPAQNGEVAADCGNAFEIDPVVGLRRQIRVDAVQVDVAPDDGVFLTGKNQLCVILQRGQGAVQQHTETTLAKQLVRPLNMYFINDAVVFVIKSIHDVFVRTVSNNPAVGFYRLGAAPGHRCVAVVQPFRKGGCQACADSGTGIIVNVLGVLGVTECLDDRVLLGSAQVLGVEYRFLLGAHGLIRNAFGSGHCSKNRTALRHCYGAPVDAAVGVIQPCALLEGGNELLADNAIGIKVHRSGVEPGFGRRQHQSLLQGRQLRKRCAVGGLVVFGCRYRYTRNDCRRRHIPLYLGHGIGNRITQGFGFGVVIHVAVIGGVFQQVQHLLFLCDRQLLEGGVRCRRSHPAPIDIFQTVVRCGSGCRHGGDNLFAVGEHGVYPCPVGIHVIPQGMGEHHLLIGCQRGIAAGDGNILAPVDVTVQIVGPGALNKRGDGFFADGGVVIKVCTGVDRQFRSIFWQIISQRRTVEILQVALAVRGIIAGLERRQISGINHSRNICLQHGVQVGAQQQRIDLFDQGADLRIRQRNIRRISLFDSGAGTDAEGDIQRCFQGIAEIFQGYIFKVVAGEFRRRRIFGIAEAGCHDLFLGIGQLLKSSIGCRSTGGAPHDKAVVIIHRCAFGKAGAHTAGDRVEEYRAFIAGIAGQGTAVAPLGQGGYQTVGCRIVVIGGNGVLKGLVGADRFDLISERCGYDRLLGIGERRKRGVVGHGRNNRV